MKEYETVQLVQQEKINIKISDQKKGGQSSVKKIIINKKDFFIKNY